MAQGKYGASSVWLLANGYNLISSKLKTLTHKLASVLEDTTGLGDTAAEMTPVGLLTATFTQSGAYFDTTATTGAHAALSSPQSSPQATAKVVCFGLAGNTLGEEFVGAEGMFQFSYDVMAEVGALTKANAEYTVTGRVERGQILQPLATKTGDWNGDTDNTELDYTLVASQRVIPITSATKANPCVVTTTVPHGLTTGQVILVSGNSLTGTVINVQQTVTVISTTTFSNGINTSGSAGAGTGGSFVLASTVNGAVGFLQVTACTGFTNFVGKIRDSADNSTYADLVTFADNVVAPYAERVAVAGTVDRYLIIDGNVTGSGSITLLIGCARL